MTTPPAKPPPATYTLVSPPAAGNAAIAVIELRGDLDPLFTRLGIQGVSPPQVRLRGVAGIDTLVIARPEPGLAWLFPHAGPVIIRRLLAELDRCGATPAHQPLKHDGPSREALCAALSHAASPLAIDLLLDQPRRWTSPSLKPVSGDIARQLRRLIDPPTIVALGPPNIGKSSLLNALANRTVSIVADEPGTTRDHVGAQVDFAGLVVRYIDAPGIQPTLAQEADPIQAEAQNLALLAAASADLVLLCGDASSGFLPEPPEGVPCLRVGLRSDLGVPRDQAVDAVVSVREHQRSNGQRGGLDTLVATVRETLVPEAAMADPGVWPLWVALGGA